MSKAVRAVLGLAFGYFAGVVFGALLIWLFSTNTHDRSLELTITSALVTGPIGAVIGLVIGFLKK